MNKVLHEKNVAISVLITTCQHLSKVHLRFFNSKLGWVDVNTNQFNCVYTALCKIQCCFIILKERVLSWDWNTH